MGVMVQIGGYFADYLRFREHMTTTQVRKLCNCGAFIFQAIFLLAAAHSTTPTAVVANLTVAVGLGGFAWAGFRLGLYINLWFSLIYPQMTELLIKYIYI